jgi:formylglycine-generating enzyme required for sulfatase activity
MSMKRLIAAALLFMLVGSATDANAQRLYLQGGALVAEESELSSSLTGTLPAVSGGIHLDYANFGRIRAGLTYQDLLSLEAAIQLHPLGVDAPVNPYIFAGYGRYFSRGVNDEKGMIPLGVGVEYGVQPNLAISLEVAGRWGLVERTTIDTDDTPEIVAGIMPSLGVVYKLNRIERQEPGATPVEEEEGPREPGDPGDMEGFARQQGFGQRDGGVSSPFQDPTQLTSGGAPSNFEPPNRDSIKSSQPLMISGPNDAAFDDPGVPPISGEVVVSEDGNMVRIPDGTFIMGLTDEDQFDIQNAGRKLVTISSFYMDRFEVTNAEYRNFLNNADNSEELLPDSAAWAESASRADWSTYFYGSTYDDYPVVAISWEEAGEYCESQGKRLPTEAEWEYAARSGRVGGIYPWAGFSPQDGFGRWLANHNPGRQGQAADGYAFTAPVGSYPPSRWGLHDVAGNVAEWVEDAYTPTYSQLSDLDPVYRDESETRHVIRGGSWSSNSFRIGVGFRDYQEKDDASPRIGVRCAADISQIEGVTRQGPGGAARIPSPNEQQGAQQGPPQQGQPPQGQPQQGQPPQGQPPAQGQPPQGQQGQPPQGQTAPPPQGQQQPPEQPPQQGGGGGF